MNIKRDLQLLLQEARYLPYLGLSNPGDLNADRPRDLGRRNRTQLARAVDIAKLVSLGDSLSSGLQLEDVYYINHDRHANAGEKWMFINGIMTDRHTAYNNGAALNQMLGRPIYVFHNPTHGISRDLAECIFARTFDHYSAIATSIFRHLAAYLSAGERVRIVAHSQGGIIASTLLKLMADRGWCLDQGALEIFTIAGAQDEWPHIPNVYAEHFANERDFVARIGVIAFSEEMQSPVHTRPDATGHLLNDHYLGALARGDYCGGKSKLFGYLNRESPVAEKVETLVGVPECRLADAPEGIGSEDHSHFL
ncbi:hypothetical protein LPB19_03610 [Marinobacter salinisoli]|uniref:DUF726 domain-containing protein n=1 Tax=Marinobacter salinisoli TaxID=2769486 RepID=A0ABX7MT29_9GAMM|nr:hypothetical protein [Marinobacter salinisoli]QSP95517.1 hypothetical protein LPB19_03610 [Marinobacter salinisoli]